MCSLSVSWSSSNPTSSRYALSLEALAGLGSGDGEQDARLLGAATATRAALSLPPAQAERAAVTALAASLRERLGDGFDAAHQAGAALSLAEAAAYAGRARGPRARPPGDWESLTPTELAAAAASHLGER